MNGVEAQIQVLLDGHIVSAFAAVKDWQVSTTVLAAAASCSIVEVRLICPAQDDEGTEDDSGFQAVLPVEFEAGFAQFRAVSHFDLVREI